MNDDRDPPSDEVNPTVRWLVHGAWKIALTAVVIALVVALISVIVD